MTAVAASRHDDAVARFERHRTEMIRARRAMNVLFIVLFVAALAASIHVSRFYPERLTSGLPRILEYFGTIMPNLEWDKLLLPRGTDGRAVPGSITYWYADFGTYVRLIFETILMALTATILGSAAAFLRRRRAQRR